MDLTAPLLCDLVKFSGFSAPNTFIYSGCLFLLCMASTALPPWFLMPFLAVIWVNFTSTDILWISCIKYVFYCPVLVANWVSYFPPPNFISQCSTPFPVLALLGLVFVFLRCLVSRSTASISFSSWFISISSGCSMYSYSINFLVRNSQWWSLLGHFGLGFLWCCYLDHFACLMGVHLYMYLLWCSLPTIHFQWCHHFVCLHILNIFHLLRFVSCHIFLWLVYLGFTQKMDTPWSCLAASS